MIFNKLKKTSGHKLYLNTSEKFILVILIPIYREKYLGFYYKTDSSPPNSGRQVVQSDSNRIIQKSHLYSE